MKNLLITIVCGVLLFSCKEKKEFRNEISLNGTWEIARSDSIASIPSLFPSKIQVPGLVDMAIPGIIERDSNFRKSIFWYKRKFLVEDPNSGAVQLKINKACYRTWVFVNGKMAGGNVLNFTPAIIDIKPWLNKNGKENEMIIAVGCRNNLPDTVTNGGDFEKIKYIPGIYDDVKLTITGYPFIKNVQTVPDVLNKKLRVVAEIMNNKKGGFYSVDYEVREALSGKVIANGSAKYGKRVNEAMQKADFVISMNDCHLWSPEDPFLYELELRTKGDNCKTRFGMRTFIADKNSRRFLLNGKPYYLRGTNVCIFRFFEDSERNGLPWKSEWVTKLHERFKEMHWDSIRYCIGFPPERWYEIADSLGFLIQDEYPVWTGDKGGFEKLLPGINTRNLSGEYMSWMRERWNHPCVVVWDAQNESVNDTTAKAINRVRSFDLSGRPWDNGWAAPASDNDAIESHPYLFVRYMGGLPGKTGYLKELLEKPLVPANDPNEHSPSADGKHYNNPVILNEYGWIWLNRNGSTTTLTDNVYKNVFPEATTPEKRFEIYAKNLAILTEFWRTHRKAAAVMHFCGLGYSRPNEPRGQTSDNFIDIKNLIFEPHFYKYIKPAFSPVSIMADFWEKSMKRRQHFTLPVNVINDTYDQFKDSIRIGIYKDEKKVYNQSVPVIIEGPGEKIIELQIVLPEEPGKYRLETGIVFRNEPVNSIREFIIE